MDSFSEIEAGKSTTINGKKRKMKQQQKKPNQSQPNKWNNNRKIIY